MSIIISRAGAHLRNARRRFERLVQSGKLIQPYPHSFVDAEKWERESIDRKIVERISVAARQHPTWTVAGVSAAALYGATVWPSFHKNIHFAVDSHTTTSRRAKLPVRFHYVKDCRLTSSIEKFIHSRIPEQPLLDASDDVAKAYTAINDSYGILNGILVTSPLQTMFDCARTTPFKIAMEICDYLARVFHITRDMMQRFLLQRRRCWRAKYVAFIFGFIDAKSENGGESFCRAAMIEEGFEQPILQYKLQNPLYNPRRKSSTLQNTRTIRPDFVWLNVPSPTTPFPHIAAELDGKQKYYDAAMLGNLGVKDVDEVLQRQRDREQALSLLGFYVTRFQFSEASSDNGWSLKNKLLRAGVPLASKTAREKRQKWLARTLGAATLMRLD